MLEIPLSDLDPAFPETGAILPAAALVGSRDLPIYGSAEGGGGSMIRRYNPEKLDFTLDRAEWQHCHLRVGQYDGPR